MARISPVNFHGLNALQYVSRVPTAVRGWKAGQVKLTVTPSIGGRLMDIEVGGRKLLFNKPHLFPAIPEICAEMLQGRQLDNWDAATVGGEKTWPAPQGLFDGLVPFPMLNLGEYRIDEEKSDQERVLRLISQECPVSHLQIIRTFVMENNIPGSFRIISELKNLSNKKTIKAAPWDILQVRHDPSARVFVGPLSGSPIPLAVDEKREIPFNVDGGMNENGFRTLHFTPAITEMFKTGLPIAGDRAYITTRFPEIGEGPGIEMRLSFPNFRGKQYPHATSTELFGCADYHEQEPVNPLEDLAPGQTSRPLVVNVRLELTG